VLTPETDLTAFKCAEGDLNEFLLDESKDYQIEYLAVTYLLVNAENGDIIAYYSLLNDVVRLNETEKSVRNRINRKIPFSKQRNHYPAVKIGRLAVSEAYAGHGIGRLILDSVKYVFTHGNRTGCRFVTVDALTSATGFYERNKFRFFTEKDQDDDTRLMYFDLKDFE
jgi:GNAT superfamily N-acetyltransferase